MFIWLILEVYLAIICASALALKPLYMQWIQAPISKVYGTYRRSKASHGASEHTSSWRSYPSKTSKKEFEKLEGKKGTEMNIFVRNDIEMATEMRQHEDETSDDDLVLPRHTFSAFPSPASD